MLNLPRTKLENSYYLVNADWINQIDVVGHISKCDSLLLCQELFVLIFYYMALRTFLVYSLYKLLFHDLLEPYCKKANYIGATQLIY